MAEGSRVSFFILTEQTRTLIFVVAACCGCLLGLPGKFLPQEVSGRPSRTLWKKQTSARQVKTRSCKRSRGRTAMTFCLLVPRDATAICLDAQDELAPSAVVKHAPPSRCHLVGEQGRPFGGTRQPAPCCGFNDS